MGVFKYLMYLIIKIIAFMGSNNSVLTLIAWVIIFAFTVYEYVVFASFVLPIYMFHHAVKKLKVVINIPWRRNNKLF